jgi:hypothetical protein
MICFKIKKMNVLKFKNVFDKVWSYLLVLLFIVLIMYVYKSSPTSKSQKLVSIDLYNYDRNQKIIGILEDKYFGGHHVPHIVVKGEDFSIDDSTFSRVEYGDSICKKSKSDFFIIYRNGVFYDSSDIKLYYRAAHHISF